jgi:hypothetical protein
VFANVVAKASHAAFALHDQDPGRRHGMADMLVAFLGYTHGRG